MELNSRCRKCDVISCSETKSPSATHTGSQSLVYHRAKLRSTGSLRWILLYLLRFLRNNKTTTATRAPNSLIVLKKETIASSYVRRDQVAERAAISALFRVNAPTQSSVTLRWATALTMVTGNIWNLSLPSLPRAFHPPSGSVKIAATNYKKLTRPTQVNNNAISWQRTTPIMNSKRLTTGVTESTLWLNQSVRRTILPFTQVFKLSLRIMRRQGKSLQFPKRKLIYLLLYLGNLRLENSLWCLRKSSLVFLLNFAQLKHR